MIDLSDLSDAALLRLVGPSLRLRRRLVESWALHFWLLLSGYRYRRC